jgi:hypothetical protein
MTDIGPPPTPDEIEASDSKPPATTEPSMARAQMRVGRLTTIQAALGLPAQSLAQIPNVSPAQLCKWLDANDNIVLHGDSLRRLALVENLAKEWRLRSNAPLSLVGRKPLADGGTIIVLLSARDIDSGAVTTAFDELAQKRANREKSPSQHMVAAGFARRPSHRSLPFDD